MSRFAFVVGANQVGGAERQVQQLSRALVEAGHEARVYVLERANRRPRHEQLDFGPVPVAHLGAGRWTNPLARLRLRRALGRTRPDAALLYNTEAMALAAPVARASGVPLVIGAVRGLLFERDDAVAAALRRAAGQCDILTGNCEAICDGLRARQVAGRARVELVPNIVALPDAVEPFPATPTVLFAGTLKAVKDPATFLRAAARLREELPDVRFVVAGDGPMRSELEELSAGLGLGPAVEWLGRVAPGELPWGRASLVASSSLSEGASNTLLEALAHGRPVVATAVGGSREILRDSGAGEGVVPGDAGELAAAMLRLLADPARLAACGRSGRDYIQARHRSEAVLARQLELMGPAPVGPGGEAA